MITAYRRSGATLVEQRDFSADALAPDVLWIDLLNPVPGEEKALEEKLGFDIPTAEEMREIESSSRLYRRGEVLYLTAVLMIHSDSEHTSVIPCSFVLCADRLLTVRYDTPKSFPQYVQRGAKGQVPVDSAAAVCLGLLGSIVDRCADILEETAGELDQLNRNIFRGTGDMRSAVRDPKRPHRRIDQEKRLERLLSHVGRTHSRVSLLRESLQSMARLMGYLGVERPVEEAGPEGRQRKVLTRDLKSLQEFTDHLMGKLEFLLDAVLGLVGLRQNQTIKLFSVISVLLMPPTLVASIYGMNFEHMPELHWTYGYPMALCAMVVVAILPFLWFRYKKWF